MANFALTVLNFFFYLQHFVSSNSMHIFAEVARPLFYDKLFSLCCNAQRDFKCNVLFIFQSPKLLKSLWRFFVGFFVLFFFCFFFFLPSFPPLSPFLAISSNRALVMLKIQVLFFFLGVKESAFWVTLLGTLKQDL